MTILDLKKREVKRSFTKYLINWDKPSASKPQFQVKQFLKQHWAYDVVFEEFPVVGSKLEMDFYNATKRINIEYNGRQHNEHVPFFHGGKAGFLGSLKRDFQKLQFCEINKITQIELEEKDLDKLSKKYFKEKFGVDI